MASFIRRALRGGNLEVFKFATYIVFPIGFMYYFGTNLEERFAVPDFWPKPEQSHKIPLEREEIDQEIERLEQKKKLQRAFRRELDEQKTANAPSPTGVSALAENNATNQDTNN